jgi:hypothetical protein
MLRVAVRSNLLLGNPLVLDWRSNPPIWTPVPSGTDNLLTSAATRLPTIKLHVGRQCDCVAVANPTNRESTHTAQMGFQVALKKAVKKHVKKHAKKAVKNSNWVMVWSRKNEAEIS